MPRQLELPAAPLVERPVSAPCTQALDPSAERSCAVPGEAERSDEPQSARTQKQMEALPLEALEPPEAAGPDAPAQPPASLAPEA